jgi:hypothetical protein
MKSEYSTKLLKRKIFVRTKWIRKIKRGQYSNNKRLGVYIQMIKKGVDKCTINKMLEL